jgi:hypothetical protein
MNDGFNKDFGERENNIVLAIIAVDVLGNYDFV